MEEKLEKLRNFISSFESVAVAFSGGVDSSTLLALTKEVNEEVIAVTAISPTTPRKDLRDAERIAREIGVKHEFIETNELEIDEFVRNPPDRCYYCKKNLLTALVNFARRRGIQAVFEGTNADELKGHRPGFRAVEEFGMVYSPWAMFGFAKKEIREIARQRGFSFADKPSMACLASRIPFGESITQERLRRVEKAEELIVEIVNVRELRVRDFGSMAVIEVGKSERRKLFSEVVMDSIVDGLKKLGYEYILFDMEGYRTGKLSGFKGHRRSEEG
ncbi:ATP-dependent sacrificial sulfur transferase LarE [Archaeoglobus neptunius]|uniref:ATP-dependent sacrificial sulfur transferase LarE n=1 Tax=Archaeoglobus neptunius TaxID=2798580 RepID=UPI0019290CB1|nr:ATP-dependent sacrificial sulfur transferase LarE [Archaeoglobus neptunius]